MKNSGVQAERLNLFTKKCHQKFELKRKIHDNTFGEKTHVNTEAQKLCEFN